MVNDAVYRQICDGEQKSKLQASQAVLMPYTGQEVLLMGTFQAVQYNGQVKQLPLRVAKGTQPSLLGSYFLEKMKIDWHKIKFMHRDLDMILQHNKACQSKGRS